MIVPGQMRIQNIGRHVYYVIATAVPIDPRDEHDVGRDTLVWATNHNPQNPFGTWMGLMWMYTEALDHNSTVIA